MLAAERGMNDHRHILCGAGYRFMPEDALKLHRRSVECLRGSLADNNPADIPTVVVTHHAPSARSIHPKYVSAGPINHAFASDLDYLVEGSGAAIWVHGHVHDPFSYMIGNTRVLCNPRGYPSEAGNGFDPNLLVEV